MTKIFSLLVFLAASSTLSAAECDPKPGQKTFANKCGICHVSDEGAAATVGPNLRHVSGREIGKASGFPYSEVLANASGQWTDQRLDEFIQAPQKTFPGTAMPFEGLKSEAERKKLICYLNTLD